MQLPWFMRYSWRRFNRWLDWRICRNASEITADRYAESAMYIYKYHPWLRGHLTVMGLSIMQKEISAKQ